MDDGVTKIRCEGCALMVVKIFACGCHCWLCDDCRKKHVSVLGHD